MLEALVRDVVVVGLDVRLLQRHPENLEAFGWSAVPSYFRDRGESDKKAP